MKSASLRSGFAAIALIAIAACSAAGVQNASTIPSTGAGPATSNGVLSPDRKHHRHPTKKKQRSLASAALAIAGGSIDLNQFGSTNGWLIQFLHFGHDVAHKQGRSDRSTGNCQNGVEYSWSSSGSGQVSQSVEFFYDAACTMPYNLVTMTATYTSVGGNAKGTQETWDQNGNVISYQTFNATFTEGLSSGIGEIVVQKTSATNPSSPPTSSSGYTCLFNTGNAVDCGAGNITSLALASPTPEEVGFTQTVVGQFVTPSPAPSCPASGSGSGSGSSCCPGSGSGWNSVGGSGSCTPPPSCSPSGSSGSGSGSCSPPPSCSPSGSGSCASPSASPSAEPTDGWDWGHGHHHGGPWQGGPDGLQLQINGTGYAGPLASLSLAAGTPPAWVITGGTAIDTLTGTATIGFGGYEGHGHGWGHHGHDWGHHGPGCGSLTTISLTLNDTADGLTVALTNSTSGSNPLTGTVTETSGGAVVATMSLDYSGTGTITYSNGSVSQVQDWIIVN